MKRKQNMKSVLAILATLSLISGCSMRDAADSQTLQAVCDTWWQSIPVTQADDRREMREDELLARSQYNSACG